MAGQKTETYLLQENGFEKLLSPAREIQYNYLPKEGSVRKAFTDFSRPILTLEDRTKLRNLIQTLREKLPSTSGFESKGIEIKEK